jgi:spoIIIJ-associated protein
VQAREEGRSVVASGKTVDEAIKNGLGMLAVRADQVDIEVLTEGSRGLLGFGAENARVRLIVKPPPAPRPPVSVPRAEPPEPAKIGKGKPPERPRQEVQKQVPSPVELPRSEAEAKTPEQVGRECLLNILQRMAIEAQVEIERSEELAEEGQPPPLVLNITGEDLGILIGRRGETLRALQYLVRLMVSHRLKQWTDLVVDVENYRVRRRQMLESLAQRVAERVASTGKSQALEPMPAYERRLVHIALRSHPQVRTQSAGEGERRRVTILPKQR